MLSRRTVIALSVGIPALGLVACLGCAGLGWVFRPVSEDVTEADRATVLTVSDLASFLNTPVDASKETLTRVRQRGFGVTLQYEYVDNGIYASSEVRYVPFGAENETKFLTPSFLSVFTGKDVKVVDVPGILHWGDESRVMLVTQHPSGNKVGNMIVVRKGPRIGTYMFVGTYADDEESVRLVLGPQLDALESWDPD